MRHRGSPLAQTAVQSGPVWAAQLFLVSLLIPFYLPVGSVVLMPHRIVLLVFFLPFFAKLFFLRHCGRVTAVDWLMLGSALWALPAYLASAASSEIIEPFGLHVVEFFGGYLLARVAIRSSDDFRRMVRVFFWILAFLLPFAALESLTHRAVLLDLIPNTSVSEVQAGIRLGMRRAQTIFAHPILFGVFVSTGFGLFWYALRPRWLRFPGVAFSMAATVFSLSAGALVSLVMQSVFIFWEIVLKSLRRRWMMFAILVVIFYVVIDLISTRSPFHVLVDYATFTTHSAYNRILIWQFGTQAVWENPVFGLGVDLASWARPAWMSSSMDNYWLYLTVQFGLPAILMLGTALFLMLRRAAKADLTHIEDRMCRAGYLTVLGGLVLAGGTVHYWHAMMAFTMFIFGSGIWTFTGGGVPAGQAERPEEGMYERLSSYTRQPKVGGAIGRTAMTSATLNDAPNARRYARR